MKLVEDLYKWIILVLKASVKGYSRTVSGLLRYHSMIQC